MEPEFSLHEGQQDLFGRIGPYPEEAYGGYSTPPPLKRALLFCFFFVVRRWHIAWVGRAWSHFTIHVRVYNSWVLSARRRV